MDPYNQLVNVDYDDPEAAEHFLRVMNFDYVSDDARRKAFDESPFLITDDARQMASFADAYASAGLMSLDIAAMLKAHFK